MKMTRRILALLLAVLMFAALVACGEKKPADTNTANTQAGPVATGDVTDQGTDEPVVNPDVEGFVLPERPTQLDDETFIVIQHESKDNPFAYSFDSKNGERVATRIEEVQSLYNCTIEFSSQAYSDFATLCQQLVYDDHGGDLVFSSNNAQLRKTLGKKAEESLMEDLLVYDNIINFWDMDKWGNITARECMMTDGHFFGCSPALWYDCTPLPFYILAYNKDVLETFSVTDLQEYWEKNAWDRDTFKSDVVEKIYDDSGSTTVYALAASGTHMMRATFLATGLEVMNVDSIATDGTVKYTKNFDNPDAIEALSWLTRFWTKDKKFINAGQEIGTSWDLDQKLVDQECAICMTRPMNVFKNIVTGVTNFGLILWPGAEANMATGYFENVYAVSIPTFAINPEQSAFLMYDLFEGLEGVETFDDVIAYYRDTYFDSDLDVEFLLRKDAKVSYSYWPNEGDSWISTMYSALTSGASAPVAATKANSVMDEVIKDYICPNKVALAAYKQQGKY